MKIINSCRVCKSKNIRTFFDLGRQPLANALLRDLKRKEKFYSLSLSWCADCNLVQLNQTVEPKDLFSEYPWVTATSQVAKEFSEIFYNELISRFPRIKQGYVLEIGSNDGTFLAPFLQRGYQVLGADPARNIVEIAQKRGIPTKCCFFGKKAAKGIVKERGSAQIVFARNVLPHVANTLDFVEGLKTSLSEDGVLAIEVHYAKTILEELHYDSIYHEHLCYFTLKSLEKLLNKFKIFIYDIAKSPISGGSIIVYAKKQKNKELPIVQLYRDEEKKNKINDLDSWKNFAEKSFTHRENLLNILQEISKKKSVIVGYGASARSSTLLNFCGIDSSLISVIADQNPLKQKLFTAGSHIFIENPAEVIKKNPQFFLILAWNFAEEIKKILKNEFNYKGGVIIPLPNTPTIKQTI